MKKFLLITTIAFATIAAAPVDSKGTAMAAAQTDANANQASDIGPSAKSAPAAEEKKICKLLPSTGTRMSKSACLTAKEWKQVEAEVEGE
jgi:hypothetical protein